MQQKIQCHDCGCFEGELHDLGCDMEDCPFCGHQLISCDCIYEKLGLFDRARYSNETAFLPPSIYRNGPTRKQEKAWLKILNKQGRIPYIQYPVLCAKCGALWPEFFRVPDDEWMRFIRPDMRSSVICWDCYQLIKAQRGHVEYPTLCARCGTLWPKDFQVSDDQWAHYVQPDKRDKVLCVACYQAVKSLIDEGATK
jgi:hypothetical protein